ncbi:GrpB family protein [Haloactinomyces albus]|uniref:GrpB family protein n=1 Tax=Haloactinomyces albus TaxID=1352928 RepID=UPI0035B549C4
MEKRNIQVVDYDSCWPKRFRAERGRYCRSSGAGGAQDRARRFHGVYRALPPKPIVDINVSVSDVAEETAYPDPLQQAGDQLRVREPGHRMLRTPARDVHTHVCDIGSDWERRHLLFRDWLRHSESDRARYAAAQAGARQAGLDRYERPRGRQVPTCRRDHHTCRSLGWIRWLEVFTPGTWGFVGWGSNRSTTAVID